MMDALDFTQALVLTGGGTGGHFFPAVALAEGARQRWPERPIAFVGAQRGIEARKLPETTWPHLLLDVEGLVGRSPVAVLRGLWKLQRAKSVLVRRWKCERPWAVIGTGGYGAAPALLAARRLGIPYFLHESNAAPGSLVRQVARGARRVWCGQEALVALLPQATCRVVGTPVRAPFLRPFAPLPEHPPFTLLALGGSGGARPLNEALLALAPRLLDRFPEWSLLHQAGPKEFDRLNDAPRHDRHTLVPFLEAMDRVLEAASLVVSRSGASTCAELMACGRPAVLVPFPQAAGDHQTANAKALVARGSAQLVVQGPNLAEALEAALATLMADSGARSRMARAEANQAVTQCLDDLVERLA